MQIFIFSTIYVSRSRFSNNVITYAVIACSNLMGMKGNTLCYILCYTVYRFFCDQTAIIILSNHKRLPWMFMKRILAFYVLLKYYLLDFLSSSCIDISRYRNKGSNLLQLYLHLKSGLGECQKRNNSLLRTYMFHLNSNQYGYLYSWNKRAKNKDNGWCKRWDITRVL